MTETIIKAYELIGPMQGEFVRIVFLGTELTREGYCEETGDWITIVVYDDTEATALLEKFFREWLHKQDCDIIEYHNADPMVIKRGEIIASSPNALAEAVIKVKESTND